MANKKADAAKEIIKEQETAIAAQLTASWTFLSTQVRFAISEHGSVRFPAFYPLLSSLSENWAGDVMISPLAAAHHALSNIQVPDETVDALLQNYLNLISRYQIMQTAMDRPIAYINIQRQVIASVRSYLQNLLATDQPNIMEKVAGLKEDAHGLAVALATALRTYQLDDQDEPRNFQEMLDYYASGNADLISYVISTGINALDVAIESGLKPGRMT